MQVCKMKGSKNKKHFNGGCSYLEHCISFIGYRNMKYWIGNLQNMRSMRNWDLVDGNNFRKE